MLSYIIIINIYIYIHATYHDSLLCFPRQSKDTGASPSLPDNHQQVVGPHGYAFDLHILLTVKTAQDDHFFNGVQKNSQTI